MARNKLIYVCQECGANYPKWAGFCPSCKSYNTIVEEAAADESASGSIIKLNGTNINLIDICDANGDETVYESIGMKEFDRVLGGGIVSGACILLGGDPGIGKSTILLQVVAKYSAMGNECIYISGEESESQIKLRASRLGLATDSVHIKIASTPNVKNIIKTLQELRNVKVVIIDSIQTMFIDDISSAPGTVSQVRTCAAELIRIAKERGFALFLVGHVTKEGTIAGPRVLEHMVDTVMYFEGERNHQFRILRTFKNRFGATNEIGIFEMTGKGLTEVENPSALFIAERLGNTSGSAVFAGIEGTRPLLMEIQALVSTTSYGNPKRTVIGWDANRLSMLLAVLESRAGISFANSDVYLNIAGGFKITEPACDVAVAVALISAKMNIPASATCAFCGEIGLSGEVRAVSQVVDRIKEAEKLGFTNMLIPKVQKKDSSAVAAADGKSKIKITEIGNIKSLVEIFEHKK
jgi:DNA repair protein RadA/Sms